MSMVQLDARQRLNLVRHTMALSHNDVRHQAVIALQYQMSRGVWS